MKQLLQLQYITYWTLDNAFREDECRVRVGHSDEIFAILGHVTLNLLKQEKRLRLASGLNA